VTLPVTVRVTLPVTVRVTLPVTVREMARVMASAPDRRRRHRQSRPSPQAAVRRQRIAP
jgi:hypothetical protein